MAKVVSPTGKARLLAPVHPNQGVEAAYRRRLDAMVEQMHASIVYWLKAAYRANTPRMAQDRTPAEAIGVVMKRLVRRWQDAFSNLAGDLARHFSMSVADRCDASLKAALRRGGMTVKFQTSPVVNDVIKASVEQNVTLIKSIASQHLDAVQGAVMRSVQAGRDLGPLAKELEQTYGVTKRRAAFIARSQNNMATAAITRARQKEIGVTEAIWMHSGGGREPRPSHVKAGREKLRYNIDTGAEIDGERIFPGQLPNCRCVSRAVIPGFE